MVDLRELKQGNTATLKPGSILHVLTGKYPHKVDFTDDESKSNSSVSSSSASSSEMKKGKKDDESASKRKESTGSQKRKHDDSNSATETKQLKISSSSSSYEKKTGSISDFFETKHKTDKDAKKSKSREYDKHRQGSSGKKDDESATKRKESTGSQKRKHDDSNSPTETKRQKLEEKSEEEDDDDLDEETREIQRKLKAFQNTASPSKKHQKREENGVRPSVSSQIGSPNAEDKWEEKGTLLMYTSKDVVASSKVRKEQRIKQYTVISPF